jgi:NAD-dependent deacetylase
METPSENQMLDLARNRLAEAHRVAALTGAGISAESGVPTFRGAGGLWKSFRSEDLATPEAFARDPEIVWEWYNWRRGLIAEKDPNPGHHALAGLEQQKDFTLITQNVDGLHRAAGSHNLLELHGCLFRVRCSACRYQREDRTVPLPYPPLCPECGKLLRPDVIWFGESLDHIILENAFQAAQNCEVMLVVGTSAVVQPAASLAWQAKRAGGFVIEINVEPSAFSSEADAVLLGPSGEILPSLVEGL